MGERKGDARIYVITCLIFLCIASGGVFLFLYIFLPQTQSRPWYPIAGMILVGIPWAFWFLVYLYSCFKPTTPPPNASSMSNRAAPTATTTAVDRSAKDSPANSPCGAQRRVHFGAVMVMGNQQVGGGQGGGEATDASNEGHSQETRNDSVASRESEVPLTSSASS